MFNGSSNILVDFDIYINFEITPIYPKSCPTFSFSIKLIKDDEMQELCKLFYKRKKITDVLSFSENINENFSGDIAIAESYIISKKQPSPQKFFMLLIHGMLHLFGYDHGNKTARENMRRLENTLMKNIDLQPSHEL